MTRALDMVSRADALQGLGSPTGIVRRSAEWLLSTPWYVPAGLAGLVVILWTALTYRALASSKIGISQPPDGGYVETYMMFEQSKTNPIYYDNPPGKCANIYMWKHVFDRMEEKMIDDKGVEKVVRIHHNDYFFFVFENEIDYGWPQINSFGHVFSNFNFYGLTKRGAILQIVGRVDVPAFEVRFPPLTKQP